MTVLSFVIDMDPPGGAGDVYDSFEFYGIHGSSWARVKIVEHSTIYATQGHGDNLVYITLFVFVIYMDPPWGAGDVCYNLQT